MPRLPSYGFRLDTFYIGGRLATYPPHGGIAAAWLFADTLGLSTLEINTDAMTLGDTIRRDEIRFDTVRDAAGTHHLIANVPLLSAAGYGRSVTLYPFDTSDAYHYRNVFMDTAYGVTQANTEPDGRVRVPLERVYTMHMNIPPQAIVAQHIAFGVDSAVHNDRFDRYPYDPHTPNSSQFLIPRPEIARDSMYYITVKGHMYSPDGGGGDSTRPVDDSVLTVELWCEIPKGSGFLDSNGVTHSAASDTLSYLYQTLLVRKRDLIPSPTDQDQNYLAYGSKTFLVNLRTIDGRNGPGGPLNDANTAHRFDLRIHWTGVESVALRSIAICDSMTHLLTGNAAECSECRDFRDDIISMARRAVYGPTMHEVSQSPVTRFYSGDEGKFFEHDAYDAFDSLMAEVFPFGDSETIGIRAFRANQWHHNPIQQAYDHQPEICVETYPGDVIYSLPVGSNRERYGFDQAQPASLAEHNGGRFHIPLLTPTPECIDTSYTRVYQRLHVGAYVVGADGWPYWFSWADELGHAAWASRRTGKRIIQWPGVHAPFRIVPDTTPHGFDTIRSRVQEASEIRMMINLGLCYGSRGVHYSWIGSDSSEFYASASPDVTRPYQFYNDVGPVGWRSDMRENHLDRLILQGGDADPVHFSQKHFEVADFYSGWGNRYDEMRRMNGWLSRIGLAMAGLHWRDGYSMHFCRNQSWMAGDADAQSHSRSLDSSAIVDTIFAFDRNGHLDADSTTFVELGLFDTSPGVDSSGRPDRLYDTNTIFLVNRRTFERPGDIPDTTALGRRLDSLADVRRLVVRLHNIRHPDSSQYNFLHITEVEPDTNHLPFAGPRAGLDTIIRADSAFALWMRPGAGALVRITYCRPNDVAFTGFTAMNNQRKLVFDGTFWHAVYVRSTRFRTPTGRHDTIWSDQVYYRRSLPISSQTGAIRWDPQAGAEVMVSDTIHADHYLDNRFPSLTVRADSSKPSDRVVTVVWSSYNNMDSGRARPIFARNIYAPANDLNALPLVSAVIDTVGIAWGVDDSKWGTPVVSRLHGAYLFAYADSARGIIVKARRLDTNARWWDMAGTYTTCDTVARQCPPGTVQYPTMPPFAHIAGRDSSVGIAWQQSAKSGTAIAYARLVDTVDSRDTHRVIVKNRMMVSQNDGTSHQHPSMDMTQDVWCGAQEGITWESFVPMFDKRGAPYRETWVHFSSLWTETSRSCDPDTSHHDRWRPYFDCIENPWQWTYNTTLAATAPGLIAPPVYPCTSSINARMTPHDDSVHEKITFAVVMSPIVGLKPMQQSIVEYAASFIWPTPEACMIGGFNPNGSASPTRQQGRHATLFVMSNAAASQGRIETSRQFFAKERPQGYLAQGRRVYFRISDSTPTAISGMLNDVWTSGPSGAAPVAMIPRADSLRRTDSLASLRTLFRTKCFQAHDSTTIGCSLAGRFAGDSGLAGGMHVEFIAELVDSAGDRVVAQLDSFAIASTLDSYAVNITRDMDLLSGTYYVRMRIVPVDVSVVGVVHAPLYPVEEITMPVEEEAAAKLQLVTATASSLRVSAYPNPIAGTGELRFSVPGNDDVTLTVYDAAGSVVSAIMQHRTLQEGRYALGIDTRELACGTYLVELLFGRNRSVTKMIVRR
ncbi:MAG TPA: T9SS type A sorting domain-containing protein [Candidatus Kapabacteria bacterium]|nr:T9SS type A sorting domain-containing protein [Candidatus Kapabacteria bacterium]